MTDEEIIEELSKELNRLIEEYNKLIEAQDLLPTVRMIKLMEKIIGLLGILRKVPKVLWRALFRLVRCDDGGLVDLPVEELKLLVELLKAIAELELEAEEDAARKDALRDWIRKLDETLDQWKDSWTREQAIAAVRALKAFLRDAYPAILAALLEYFGDDIQQQVEGLVLSPGTLKWILKKLIEKILIRRLGEEAAKRFIPWVGVGLTLAELIALGYVITRLGNLRELIDEMRAELVRRLVDAGLRWPTSSEYVWFKPPLFTGARVRVRAYVHCAKLVNGKPVWKETPCRVTFEQGNELTATLKENSELFDKEAGVWKLPYTINMASLEQSECMKDADICYLYLEVFITFADGNTLTASLLVGAVVM